MSPTTWALAFVAMCMLDTAWVMYMRAAAKHHAVWAALWAAAIHGSSALAVVSYTTDHRYLSATMLGTLVGTFCVVRWVKGREEKA